MSYTKTIWVNGTTPINATNLNKIEDELEILDLGQEDLQEQIDDKNIITAVLNANYTIQTDSTYETLPFKTVKSSLGNKLSVNSSGGFVIGPGVDKIRLYGQIYFFTGTTNLLKNIQVFKNSTLIIAHNKYLNALYQHETIVSDIISVEEGDVITFKISGKASDVISASDTGTYITMEVVD